MRLDLTAIHFGKHMSRHMIYEETGADGSGIEKGLYLALASESSSLFGGASARAKGFLRIAPLYGGEEAAYGYSASPSLVELNSSGGHIRFAIDGDSVLRIEGKGLALRLVGRLSFGENANRHDMGAEISLGSTRYLITAMKGSVSLDTQWDLRALRSSDPVITVEPDADGCFSAAIYDTDGAYVLPALSASLDECADRSQREFQEFFNGLTAPDYGIGELSDLAAYSLWTGFLPCGGKKRLCSDKMSGLTFTASEQALATLPLKNAETVCDLIDALLSSAQPSGFLPASVSGSSTLYEAAPPVYGWALRRVVQSGEFGSVPREKLAALYDDMSRTVGWWQKERLADNGLFYYAFPHECGWPHEDIFPDVAPVASPDLNAYMVMCADCLCKLAVLLYKAEDAAKWAALSKKQLRLMDELLRSGEKYACMNVLTGEKYFPDSLLCLIPLALGKLLPEDNARALGRLAACSVDRGCDLLLSSIIANGLLDCDLGATAEQIAIDMISSCLEKGVTRDPSRPAPAGAKYTPAACACLLYLSSRVVA
ncbi:MAG: hypothetical protein K5855_10190 [Oscillospiraceae bacterium]|nr:hypothetical protein [Oscillospiraceae bacterium]